MIDIIGLAVTDRTAQAALVAAGDPVAKRLLAVSSHLDPQVATTLTTDPDPAVSIRALARCDDADLVTRVARGAGRKAEAAVRNPRTAPDVLAAALSSANGRKALFAFCNPATPVQARTEALTPERVQRLVVVGSDRGSQGERAVRGQMLALANPSMLDTAYRWPSYVRRGLAMLPLADAAQARLLAAGNGSRWPGFDRHPVFTGASVEAMSTRQLLAAGSPHLDVQALSRADVTAQQVAVAFSARCAAGGTVEYAVLALAVDRFGPAVAHPISGSIAGSRRTAAAWWAPAAVHIPRVHPDRVQDAHAASAILRDEAAVWQTYAALADEWDGTAVQLATAARRVRGFAA